MDKYPTYLIHFNKNHSPKNGQFTNGDGDGDGIVDDRHYKKNKWAIRKGYQNADGTLTKSGKKAIDVKNESIKKAEKFDSIYGKLKDKSSELENYDDWFDIKDFESTAKELGFNTKGLVESYNDWQKFEKNNEKQIAIGYQIGVRMLDTNPNFANMSSKDLYLASNHDADISSTVLSAVMGWPISTLIGIIDSVGSGINLASYEKERRKYN